MIFVIFAIFVIIVISVVFVISEWFFRDFWSTLPLVQLDIWKDRIYFVELLCVLCEFYHKWNVINCCSFFFNAEVFSKIQSKPNDSNLSQRDWDMGKPRNSSDRAPPSAMIICQQKTINWIIFNEKFKSILKKSLGPLEGSTVLLSSQFLRNAF